LLVRNQHRSAGIDFRYTPDDFFVPGLGNGFGSVFRRSFQANDIRRWMSSPRSCGESCKAWLSISFNNAAMARSKNYFLLEW